MISSADFFEHVDNKVDWIVEGVIQGSATVAPGTPLYNQEGAEILRAPRS